MNINAFFRGSGRIIRFFANDNHILNAFGNLCASIIEAVVSIVTMDIYDRAVFGIQDIERIVASATIDVVIFNANTLNVYIRRINCTIGEYKCIVSLRSINRRSVCSGTANNCHRAIFNRVGFFVRVNASIASDIERIVTYTSRK